MPGKKFKLTARKKGEVKAKPKLRFVSKSEEPKREFPFSDEDFFVLADLIHKRSGIVMKEHKKNLVYGRLARRLRTLGIKSFSDYLHYLTGSKGETEIGYLMNAVTTNLTRFFREDHHFDHLKETALPEALQAIRANKQKRLRLWSAGCSSGEEPYSMAMVLDHALENQKMSDVDARILATDLDTSMLETGRKGTYPRELFENLPQVYRKYVERDEKEDLCHVVGRLRAYIAFKQLNLILNWPMKGLFDAIMCRNVMIYFDNQTKTEMTQKFVQLLKPGGWLYLGHSETLLGADGALQHCGRTIYRRIN